MLFQGHRQTVFLSFQLSIDGFSAAKIVQINIKTKKSGKKPVIFEIIYPIITKTLLNNGPKIRISQMECVSLQLKHKETAIKWFDYEKSDIIIARAALDGSNSDKGSVRTAGL